MSELNLIIIWENGRNKEDDIVADISNSFRISQIFDVEWSQEKFSENLTRFYGTKLPKGSEKEKHCGVGPFRLILFYDDNPVYESRPTSRGVPETVNINIFDKKALYRTWTGGGHKIHSTNGAHETNHDILLLLGISVEEYNEKFESLAPQKPHNMISKLTRDLEGANGWTSLEYFFSFINKSENYAVLRNFENLPNDYLVADHGDIDFLVEDTKNFAYFINAESLKSSFRSYAYYLTVNDFKIEIDLREIGDGYYDKSWQENILDTAIVNKSGIKIPNDENFMPALLYLQCSYRI